MEEQREKDILIKFIEFKKRELMENNTHEIVEINLHRKKEYLKLNMYNATYIKTILGIPLNPYSNSSDFDYAEAEVQIVIAPKKDSNYHPYSGNIKKEYWTIEGMEKLVGEKASLKGDKK